MTPERACQRFRTLYTQVDAIALDGRDRRLRNPGELCQLGLRELLQLAQNAHRLTN